MISLFLVHRLMNVLLIYPLCLKKCKEVNLLLSWEKSKFMVQEGNCAGSQSVYEGS